VRFFFSLVFVVLIISSGVAVVVFSTAEQGSWSLELPKGLQSLNFSLPWSTAPAEASPEVSSVKQASATPPVTVLRGQPIGDWIFNCGMNPQTSKKQCTIAQQLTDSKTKSVVFAWMIGNDGNGNLVAIWQTPTGVLVNRGVVVDVGEQPVAVPFTSCISGRCEAIANLAPDFIASLETASVARATVYTVEGQTLTFNVSVNGLAKAIDAVKAPTAS
jgi:invasion protein IalB